MSKTSRYQDAWRASSIYESCLNQGIKSGVLTRSSTDEEIEAYFKLRIEEGRLDRMPDRYIGEDLTEKHLDTLWAVVSGNDRPDLDDYYILDWWEDKPHQLAYRLILRLTRAEALLAEKTRGE